MRRLVLSLLLLAGAAAAQDESGESAQARLQRDQARVGQRLTSLRDKMERLAQRYQDEGRTRNAELLREAVARFDEQKLLDVQRDVQRGLEQGSLSTVERQDALAAGLEAVYAVLRDRRDVEELSHQADLARAGLAELGVLAENQRRLLQRTRATSDTPAGLLKEALKSAAALLEALQQTEQAAQLGAQSEARLGEAELARQLAGQQRALAGEAQPTAETQALLATALEMLRERLEQPTPSAEDASLAGEALASAQSARERAAEAAAEAAQQMQAAKSALEAAARNAPAPPREGEPTGGEPRPGSTPTPGAPQPGSPPTPGAPQPGSTPTPGAPQPGSTPTPGTPPSPSPPSSGAPGEPQPSGGEGPPRSESPAQAAARQAMSEAAERLDEVGEELERSERSLAAARNRARAAAQASAEEAAQGGKTLDEVAQRLEAAQPQSGPEMLDRTRALLEELAKLRQAAQAGQMSAAGQGAASAKKSIDELIAMLKQRQAGASDTPREPPTPADLEALAQQQAELQRQVEELMRRLSELPDQGFQEPAGSAQKAMQGAQSSLRSGDPEEGATREQEAAEQLEQTAQELSGASKRYEQLRQDEVLFRLNEDLTALLQRQQEASGEVKELDAARAGEERLSRSQRRAAGRLAEQERDLATQSEALRVALQQDAALAFEHALALTRDDLSAAADKLADEQTGWPVQMLQADVEQRLGDLLAVLAAERERRAEALRQPQEEEGQPQGPPGQGKEPLVPTVAELLLIQRLEQAALARLESFARSAAARGEETEFSEAERDMLQRWAGEHQGISDLFRRKFQEAADVHVTPPEPAPPEPAPQPAPEGGPP